MPAVADHYHAHIYFERDQITVASQLYKELAAQFDLVMGRIFNRPIGPHPKPMFQVIIEAEQFAEVVTWLMHQRRGLDVLVHGVSGDDLRDHVELAMWLGNSHLLDLSALRAG